MLNQDAPIRINKPYISCKLVICIGIFIFMKGEICFPFSMQDHFATTSKKQTKPSPSEFNLELIKNIKHNGVETTLFSLIGKPYLQGTRLQLSFYLDDKKKFEAKAMIGNFTSKEKQYNLICLIDYKQTPCVVNKKLALYHEMFINSMDESIFSIEIPNLEYGAHDLLLLGLEVHPLPFEAKRWFPQIVFYRANIFVGNNQFLTYKTDTIASYESGIDFTGVIISRKCDDTMRDEPLMDNSKSHVYELCLQINNAFPIHESFAVLLFADAMQTPIINDDDITNPWFIKIKKFSLVKKKVRISRNQNINQINAIIVANPFVILEPEPEKMVKNPIIVKTSNLIVFY